MSNYDIALGMLGQLEQKKQMQQALQQMILQQKMKSMFDPEAQFRQQILSSMGIGSQQGQPSQPFQQPQGGFSGMPQGDRLSGALQGGGFGGLKNMIGPRPMPMSGGGQPTMGGFRPKGFTYAGFNFERQPTEQEMQAEINTKVRQQTALENAKPFTAEEIKIASGMSLIPQIDKLINLVRNKNVYGEGKLFGNAIPFGGSRISAFGETGPWQSVKRGMTAGAGREAGLILQDIKQIMFATGGQALTDPEIIKLGPKMEPAYKTEEQWIADLIDVRQRILDKVNLMRPNPSQVYQSQTGAGMTVQQPKTGSFSYLWQ